MIPANELLAGMLIAMLVAIIWGMFKKEKGYEFISRIGFMTFCFVFIQIIRHWRS